MANLLDLTPQDFEKLYRKHGLKPCAMYPYPDGVGRCCALGVLAKENGFDKQNGIYEFLNQIYDNSMEGGRSMLGSFASGFDSGFLGEMLGQSPTSTVQSSYLFLTLGHQVGQHMRGKQGG